MIDLQENYIKFSEFLHYCLEIKKESKFVLKKQNKSIDLRSILLFISVYL